MGKVNVKPIVQWAARGIFLWQLTPPAISKFIDYPTRVVHFRDDYGIPFPETMVLVVGAVEIVAVLSAALGFLPRVLLLPIPIVMAVAFAVAGIETGNVLVAASCVVLLLAGTGPLSLRDPSWMQLLSSIRGWTRRPRTGSVR